MKIGIVSDSHGKTKRLAGAIELLKSRGAEAILHCGDIGHEDSVKLLGHSGLPSFAVTGNSDRHLGALETAAREAGVTLSTETVEISIGPDRYVIATHGHDSHLLAALIASGQFPYVCLGHSHCFGDERVGEVHVINPGALSQPRDQHGTGVVILDTEADSVERVEL